MSSTATAAQGKPETGYGGIVLPTRDEIAATIAPYVVERHPEDSAAWKTIAGPVQRYFWKKYHITRLLKGKTRSQGSVKSEYEDTWDFRDWPDPADIRMKLTPCTWRGEGLHVRTHGTKRVHLLLLARVLQALKPKTVLEVGAGNGLNVLVLAALFPDIRFTSIELTEAGVAKARAAQAEPTLPQRLVAYAPMPVADPAGHQRADIRQGDASRLEFPDSSFDLVYTSLALEQMQAVRDAAVSECARVAREHVAMVEPFVEVNSTGTRKHYTRFNDYLNLKIAELPRFGLDPVLTFEDIPQKVTIAYGLAVSKVRGG